jgi:diguanylate cyclase (GGDEF)-like protein
MNSIRALLQRPLLLAVLGGMIAWGTAMVAIGVVDLFVRQVLLEDLRTNLARTASFTAALIDGDELVQFTSPSQDGSPRYERAVRPLRALLANNTDIRFAIAGITDGTKMYFILDGSPLDELDPVTGKSAHAPPMEYDVPTAGEREFARTHRLTVEAEPTQSAWGTGIRAQAPVYDSNRHVVGYVGITMRAERYHHLIHRVDIAALLGAIIAAVLGGINGFRIWRVQRRQEALESQLGHAARCDKLTNLANRAEFMDRLERAIERVNRGEQAYFAVLFLDFDRFKLINDTLGHVAGDELLRQIAGRLLATLRASDIMTLGEEGNVVSRFGGDEFLLLINDLRATGDAVRIAERLLNALTPPYDIHGNELHSSASIGVVTSDQCRAGAEEVVRNADVAMYEAKRAGRACTVVFDEAMHTRLARHVTIENSLRRAIGTSELYLVYQPIVDLDSGRFASAEALVRWNHPVLGAISPSEFIPIAEETGLIVALGKWVQDESCAAMAAWRSADPAGAPDTISVNVSRAELGLGDRLLAQVRETLERHGLPANVLQLEITERELMRHPEEVHALMVELRSLGVKLAMDDFGTGTSSLGVLRNYPFDTIKIDRSFVQDIGGNPDVLAVIHATVHLVGNLGMASLAEGVEKAEQVAVLLSLGCRYAQGYYFSRPVPRDALPGVIRKGLAVPATTEA